MIDKINDGGKRISYGENMAIREPSFGKGRYDLITPFGTRRIAEWYEIGAEKYTRTLTIERDDVLSVIERELKKTTSALDAVQINFTAKTCVEAVTKKPCGNATWSMYYDKEKIQTSGGKNILSGLQMQQKEEEKTHIAKKEIDTQSEKAHCEKLDCQKIHMTYYWNGNKINAQFAEDISTKLEECTLIMTITRETQEDCYVVDAITELECLKSLVKLCKRLFPTFTILQLDNSSKDNNMFDIIVSGSRNWEKGMPFSRYLDSAKRHLDKFVMGMEDEDHLAAAAWNIMAIMHHQELGQMELDDMPHYLSSTTV